MASIALIDSSTVKTNYKLSRMEIDAIKHRWRLGESRRGLAECFEVSERTIRFHCRKIPRQTGRRLIDVNEVTSLMAEGHRVPQIADSLDFELRSVRRALARMTSCRFEMLDPSYQPIAEKA